MPLVKIKRHHQITLPQNLRKRFKLEEGDYVEMEQEDDKIVLRPVKVIHPDQEYFYTKEWQKAESEADKDIAEGNFIGDFDNSEEAIKALKDSKI